MTPMRLPYTIPKGSAIYAASQDIGAWITYAEAAGALVFGGAPRPDGVPKAKGSTSGRSSNWGGGPCPGGVHRLLVRRSLEDPEDRAYYAVLSPRGTALREELVWVLGRHWAIEDAFKAAKQEGDLVSVRSESVERLGPRPLEWRSRTSGEAVRSRWGTDNVSPASVPFSIPSAVPV